MRQVCLAFQVIGGAYKDMSASVGEKVKEEYLSLFAAAAKCAMLETLYVEKDPDTSLQETKKFQQEHPGFLSLLFSSISFI